MNVARRQRMTDTKREPEPSFGPDEEGEVPLRKRDLDTDPHKWVHLDGDETPPAPPQ